MPPGNHPQEVLPGVPADARRRPPAPRGGLIARLVLLIFLAYVALGLANTFGQETTTSDARGPAAALHVVAPGTLRSGLLFQVLVQVRALRRVASGWLLFSPAWFSGLTTNAIAPQPSRQTDRHGWPAFALGEIGAGQSRTYRFYFQVNPTTIAWRRAEDVRLDDGSTPLVTVHRSISVFP
jgi:hypothetical protein